MSKLEIEKLQEMVQGMTVDQQRVVAAALPDRVLWDAIYKRFLCPKRKVMTINQTIIIDV